MRNRRVKLTAILSDAQVRAVVRGIRACFGQSFVKTVASYGVGLEDGVRFGPLARRCEQRRIELGMTVKSVARLLRVPQYKVKAIDDQHFRYVEPRIFRAYVKCLGLDGYFGRWTAANRKLAERLGLVKKR